MESVTLRPVGYDRLLFNDEIDDDGLNEFVEVEGLDCCVEVDGRDECRHSRYCKSGFSRRTERHGVTVLGDRTMSQVHTPSYSAGSDTVEVRQG